MVRVLRIHHTASGANAAGAGEGMFLFVLRRSHVHSQCRKITREFTLSRYARIFQVKISVAMVQRVARRLQVTNSLRVVRHAPYTRCRFAVIFVKIFLATFF